MSGSMAIVANVETTLSLLQRKISIDGLSFSDSNYLLKLSNGEVVKDGECPCISEGKVILPNREYYSGSLLGSLPEGSGKYMWTDGCKYEGEWRAGVRHGYGKLQWPCGAFYLGEFSGGYMNGNGTYTGADRTYKGRWRLNLKHGLGYELYSCGDVIEGTWIRGTPEGPCKYSWAIGNVYLGNMKSGKMSGKGTLTWINGDTYEGSWLNDMMNGFGVYTWGDGSCYIGTWTRGLKDGMGTFYPRFSRLPPGQQLYLNALRKRGLLPDFRKLNQVSHIRHPSLVDMEGNTKNVGNQGSRKLTLSSSSSSSDKVSKGNLMNLEQSSWTANVSLQRRWSLEVSIDKVIGDDFSEFCGDDGDHEDTNSPILEREYMQGVLISELVVNSFSLSSKTVTRRKKMLTLEIKKPGETIIKGHRRYDLMLCLQLGIRYTVGKNTSTLGREARASDFGSRASFWMNFNKDGSQLTPPHQADDFKWKDYCPMVFRNLREMFKIDAADYMMSICGNDTLQELSSPGKSGSAFFLSQDDRFMIKTLRKSEVKVLLQILPAYHQHVQTYENTLITKFFGLHRIIPSSGQKFRFVVMGNMFCTEPRIHRRFDLKGSSLGRSVDKVEIDENTILKDLDLNYCFYLEPSWQEAVLKQIEIDSKFLESMHIMDYSLLLGVHYRAPQHLKSLMSTGSERFTADGLEIVAEEEALQDEISPQGLILVPRGSDDKSVTVGSHIRGGRLRASSATGDEEVDLLLPGTARLQIQLGVNMPARAECIGGKEDNKVFNEAYDVVLYLGIIDILQDYNITKKIEHAYKSMQFDSLSISAVDPTFYSQRFLHFIQKVFPRKCYS